MTYVSFSLKVCFTQHHNFILGTKVLWYVCVKGQVPKLDEVLIL